MRRVFIALILFFAFLLDYSFFPQLILNYQGYFLVLTVLASLALLEEVKFLWLWFFAVAFLWDVFSVLPKGIFLSSVVLLGAVVFVARTKIIFGQLDIFLRTLFFIVFFLLFRLIFNFVMLISSFFISGQKYFFFKEMFFIDLIYGCFFVVISSLVYLPLENFLNFFEKDKQRIKL